MTQLALIGLAPGQRVKISGVRGTFKVIHLGSDDSVTVYGGPQNRERYRSFHSSKVVPATAKLSVSEKTGH